MKYRIGLTLLLMLFASSLFYQNMLQNLQAPDDYLYTFVWDADISKMTNPVNSISELVRSQFEHYKHQNPRFLSHTLLQLFLALPIWIFNLINTLIFFLIPMFIVRMIRGRFDLSVKSLRLFLFVLLLFFSFHFDWGFSYLVKNGSVNYTWTLALAMYAYIWLSDMLLRNQSRPTWLFLFMVNLCLGFTNEHICLTSFVFYLALSIFRSQDRRVFIYSSISLLVAGLVLFFSPTRMNASSLEYDFLYRLYYFAKHFVIIQLYYLPIYFGLWFFSRSQKWNSIHLSLVGLSIFSNLIMILAPIYQNRAGLFGFVLLIICLGFFFDSAKENRLSNKVLFVLVSLFICVAICRTEKMVVSNHLWQADYNEILQARIENREASVSGLPFSNHRDRFIYNFKFDPDHFSNRSAANFFNVEGIKLNQNYYVDVDSVVSLLKGKEVTFIENEFTRLKQNRELLISETVNYSIVLYESNTGCSQDGYFMMRPRNIFGRLAILIPDKFLIHFMTKHDLNTCFESKDGVAYYIGQIPNVMAGDQYLIGMIDKRNINSYSVERLSF